MAENKGASNKNQAYAISDVEGTRKLYAGWADSYDSDTTEGMGYVAHKVVADLAAEFLDKGTPVLDIKPFLPGHDSASDARVPDWVERASERRRSKREGERDEE